MYKYEVGQKIEQFIGHQEGVKFDISDDGANMLVFFRDPTENEVNQFKEEKRFEIRFTELYGIIMITVKIGSLNWMDAPYSPHLSKNLTHLIIPSENQGLGLQLYFINSRNGEIKSMRLIGLSSSFTNELFKKVIEQKSKEFDVGQYYHTLNRIYSIYTTNQIVKNSKTYCKIN